MLWKSVEALALQSQVVFCVLGGGRRRSVGPQAVVQIQSGKHLSTWLIWGMGLLVLLSFSLCVFALLSGDKLKCMNSWPQSWGSRSLTHDVFSGQGINALDERVFCLRLSILCHQYNQHFSTVAQGSCRRSECQCAQQHLRHLILASAKDKNISNPCMAEPRTQYFPSGTFHATEAYSVHSPLSHSF